MLAVNATTYSHGKKEKQDKRNHVTKLLQGNLIEMESGNLF